MYLNFYEQLIELTSTEILFYKINYYMLSMFLRKIIF